FYYKRSKSIYDSIHDPFFSVILNFNLGTTFFQAGDIDSALYFEQQAYNDLMKMGRRIHPLIFAGLGDIQVQLNNPPAALNYFKLGIENAKAVSNWRALSTVYNSIAKFYRGKMQIDSAIYFAKAGLETASALSYKKGMLGADT